MSKLAFLLILLAVPGILQSSSAQKSRSLQAIDGCLVREAGDYFLQPLSENAGVIHLVADPAVDLSAYVGQRLRVRGTEQPSPASETTPTAPNRPIEKQPPPSTLPSTLPSGTPDPNVPVTQLPQSAQAGEGTEGFRGNAPNRELHVSSVEVISGRCTDKKP